MCRSQLVSMANSPAGVERRAVGLGSVGIQGHRVHHEGEVRNMDPGHHVEEPVSIVPLDYF